MAPTNVLFTLFSVLSLAMAQKIWINAVPEYSSLSSCAVAPLSQIVRNMNSGCGDGNAATSFSCFCSQNSSKYNKIIATDVSKRCNGTMDQVITALQVFQGYCDLGATKLITSTVSYVAGPSIFAIATSPASPTSAPTAPTASSTSSSLLTSSSPSPLTSPTTLSTGVKVAITLGAVATILVLGAIGFFFFKRRSHISLDTQSNPNRNLSPPDMEGMQPTYGQFKYPQSIHSVSTHKYNRSVNSTTEILSDIDPKFPMRMVNLSPGTVMYNSNSRPRSGTIELPASNHMKDTLRTEMP